MCVKKPIDKYIQALILSLLVHLGLYLGLNYMQPFEYTEKTLPIEITYHSAQDQEQFVSDPKLGEIVKKLQSQAKFLSQFNRQVKEELIARKTGKTENRTSAGQARSAKKAKKTAKPKSQLKLNPEMPDGLQVGRIESSQLLGQEAAIGESSISEHIPNIKEGGFTSLNTKQFTFYTFFYRLGEQIRPRWTSYIRGFMSRLSPATIHKIGKSRRVTVVEVILDRKGYYLGHRILRSSGVKGLDMATVKAFKSAAPFLNPPDGLIEADNKVRLKYSFFIEWNPSYLATN